MVNFPIHLNKKILFYGWWYFWPGILVMFLFLHWHESDTNKIWTLGAVTLWLFFGVVSKYCALSSPKTIRELGKLTLWSFFGVSNYWALSKPNKIWSPGAVTLELFFWEFQVTKHCYQQKYFKSTFLLSMGKMHICFEWCHKFYCLEQIFF